MKRLYAAHPTIFSLVVFAFILDVVMLASTGGLWRDSSFAIGSTLVVVYFFGISSLLRFAIFRNRIHLGITWVFTIVLWFGWFALQVALNQGQYRPSLLFIMCLIVAFKTMRLEQSEEEKNTSAQVDEDDQKNLASQSTEPQETLVAPISSSQRKKQKAKAETAQSNPVAPTPCIPSPSIDSCTESGGTGNLYQLKHALGAIAGIGCLVALCDMPNDYYNVLRLVVVAACAIIIWDIQKSTAKDTKKTLVSVGFGILAVIYNPIAEIDHYESHWLWVNLAGAIGFTLYLAGLYAAISLTIISVCGVILVSHAKELRQIAADKAWEESQKIRREADRKEKQEKQEKLDKQWAEWEAERIKKEQIAKTKSELFMAEWEANKAKKEKIEKESRELESQKYLEAERKRKELRDREIRESDARIAAFKKQRDADLAEKEFTIIGQVKNPGTYKCSRFLPLNIFKAIEKAGGETRQANMKEIKIKRAINGQPQTLIVNTRKLDDTPWVSFDILSGDIIEVSKK